MSRVLVLVRVLSVIALLSLSQAGAAAVSLQIESGKLIGATGVTVLGHSYDVSFVDGSCNSLFEGCNSANFAFSNQADAVAASHALADLVFLGVYDLTPALTAGCSAADFLGCSVYTPYMTAVRTGNDEVWSAVFGNEPGLNNRRNAYGPLFYWADQTSSPRSVFAVWQLSSPVPEPDIAVLFFAGLGWLGLVRRNATRWKSPISG